MRRNRSTQQKQSTVAEAVEATVGAAAKETELTHIPTSLGQTKQHFPTYWRCCCSHNAIAVMLLLLFPK